MQNTNVKKMDSLTRFKMRTAIIAEKVYYFITMYLVYLIYLLPAAYTVIKCRKCIVDHDGLGTVFKGKTVAIVGPADTAYEYQNGEFIDSCDIVIRLNNAYLLVDPDDREKSLKIGTKTNVIFHYFSYKENFPWMMDVEKLKEQGLVHVISILRNRRARARRHRGIRCFLKRNYDYLMDKLIIISKKSYSRFYNDLGSKPTIGHVCMRTVLECAPASVFITGFSFYTTPYASGYDEEKAMERIQENFHRDSTSHKPHNELSYFVSQVKNTPVNVKLDPYLEELVSKQ